MAQKKLILDPEKCVGCRTCEMVCSLRHNHGCSPTRSRVRVVTVDTQDMSMPVMCQHCETPLCQKVCPANAISRDATTDAMILDTDKCLGCQMCVYACPFGALSFDPTDRTMIKCDLCEGDPECAKFCPSEAIQFVRNDNIAATKRRAGVVKMLHTIAQGAVED